MQIILSTIMAQSMNAKIKDFAENNKLTIVDNDIINESGLSTKKLDLNKKGKSYFANNLLK